MEKIEIKKDFLLKSVSETVKEKSGVNINSCWNCKTCTSGCSFSEEMDYHPHQILRMLQLGMVKEVLESETIWICVACSSCTMGCPQNIDMAAVMETLRLEAVEEKKVKDNDVHDFHKIVVESVEKYGKTHKLEVMMKYKIKKKDFFSDINIGLKMFQKRKLKILPPGSKKPGDLLTSVKGVL